MGALFQVERTIKCLCPSWFDQCWFFGLSISSLNVKYFPKEEFSPMDVPTYRRCSRHGWRAFGGPQALPLLDIEIGTSACGNVGRGNFQFVNNLGLQYLNKFMKISPLGYCPFIFIFLLGMFHLKFSGPRGQLFLLSNHLYELRQLKNELLSFHKYQKKMGSSFKF